MKYLNQIQLIGYVTEPKITDVTHGKMGTFSIITKRYGGKSGTGESTFVEDWFNCETFGKLAENLKLRKGDFVRIYGEMRTHKKDGIVYYNVHVDKLNVLLKKPADAEHQSEENAKQEE